MLCKTHTYDITVIAVLVQVIQVVEVVVKSTGSDNHQALYLCVLHYQQAAITPQLKFGAL